MKSANKYIIVLFSFLLLMSCVTYDREEEAKAYESARCSRSITELNIYLDKYIDGPNDHVKEISDRLGILKADSVEYEKILFETALGNKVNKEKLYLKKRKRGIYREEVQKMYDEDYALLTERRKKQEIINSIIEHTYDIVWSYKLGYRSYETAIFEKPGDNFIGKVHIFNPADGHVVVYYKILSADKVQLGRLNKKKEFVPIPYSDMRFKGDRIYVNQFPQPYIRNVNSERYREVVERNK